MSIHFCIASFLLVSAFFSYVNPQSAIHEYVIRKDFFRGFKAGEFSVYDKSEKHVYYRIESKVAFLQEIEILAYPSKQVVGRLKAKLQPLLYKAEFSILDSQSNQWINGLIQQNLKLLTSSFNIDWNGRSLTMKSEAGSLTSKFFDTNGDLLAQFRIRASSLLWTRKYDMQIFSNKFPEQIYLLALAGRDQTASTGK